MVRDFLLDQPVRKPALDALQAVDEKPEAQDGVCAKMVSNRKGCDE